MKSNIISELKIESVDIDCQDWMFFSTWMDLLSRAPSHNSIYQSPQFFKHLQETNKAEDYIELFSIKSSNNSEILGIVPVRLRELSFNLSIGKKSIVLARKKVIIILGTTSLLPLNSQWLEELLLFLQDNHPNHSLISFSAIPEKSDLNRYITTSEIIRSLYGIHVLNG